MKSYVITITEIDDTEFALGELDTQMSDIRLLKNSVGIVTVSTEFFNSGIYTDIAKAIPFPLVGMTTYTQSANGKTDTFLLSILILTSNDCEFACGSSGIIPEKGDVSEITQECYRNVRAKLAGPAKIALLYIPFMEYQSPHKYLNAISGVDESVPIFGSLAAAEVTKMGTDTRTICGDNSFGNQLVTLLIAGDISPKFFIGSVTKESVIVPNVGEVTKAQDNFVMEINNTKINTVLERLGYNAGSLNNEGSLAFVFMVNEKDKDGNYMPSSAVSITTLDDGVGVFGGHVPVGSVLSLAVTTKDVIAATARNVLSQIKESHRGKTVLIYTCIGRQIALLDDYLMEFEIINEELTDGGFNFVAACSGGEICPKLVTETKAYNSEHDQSLVACVF